tara:strand:+ start:2958 stop:3083 length:126 start_codon:yes stop_codon:yes gene_type:complete
MKFKENWIYLKKKINKKYETFSVFLQKDIQKIKKILIKNAN